MDSEEKDAITKLVREYSDIFHIDGGKLPWETLIYVAGLLLRHDIPKTTYRTAKFGTN
ncbi:unnamed protein product [Acanthoscelides obtectus]|uniref:Uncharacterized protein n=1 Tax=Acanthoscelides obtectus TaxID=200917 RepID=A0A9P0QGR3_ACAOB|nr:unnamed protein product [Acanthoscelides obtectus]